MNLQALRVAPTRPDGHRRSFEVLKYKDRVIDMSKLLGKEGARTRSASSGLNQRNEEIVWIPPVSSESKQESEKPPSPKQSSPKSVSGKPKRSWSSPPPLPSHHEHQSQSENHSVAENDDDGDQHSAGTTTSVSNARNPSESAKDSALRTGSGDIEIRREENNVESGLIKEVNDDDESIAPPPPPPSSTHLAGPSGRDQAELRDSEQRQLLQTPNQYCGPQKLIIASETTRQQLMATLLSPAKSIGDGHHHRHLASADTKRFVPSHQSSDENVGVAKDRITASHQDRMVFVGRPVVLCYCCQNLLICVENASIIQCSICNAINAVDLHDRPQQQLQEPHPHEQGHYHWQHHQQQYEEEKRSVTDANGVGDFAMELPDVDEVESIAPPGMEKEDGGTVIVVKTSQFWKSTCSELTIGSSQEEVLVLNRDHPPTAPSRGKHDQYTDHHRHHKQQQQRGEENVHAADANANDDYANELTEIDEVESIAPPGMEKEEAEDVMVIKTSQFWRSTCSELTLESIHEEENAQATNDDFAMELPAIDEVESIVTPRTEKEDAPCWKSTVSEITIESMLEKMPNRDQPPTPPSRNEHDQRSDHHQKPQQQQQQRRKEEKIPVADANANDDFAMQLPEIDEVESIAPPGMEKESVMVVNTSTFWKSTCSELTIESCQDDMTFCNRDQPLAPPSHHQQDQHTDHHHYQQHHQQQRSEEENAYVDEALDEFAMELPVIDEVESIAPPGMEKEDGVMVIKTAQFWKSTCSELTLESCQDDMTFCYPPQNHHDPGQKNNFFSSGPQNTEQQKQQQQHQNDSLLPPSDRNGVARCKSGDTLPSRPRRRPSS